MTMTTIYAQAAPMNIETDIKSSIDSVFLNALLKDFTINIFSEAKKYIKYLLQIEMVV